MKYDVFISYSSRDQKVVEGLCAYLEQLLSHCKSIHFRWELISICKKIENLIPNKQDIILNIEEIQN